jgi:mRNA interferase MazF
MRRGDVVLVDLGVPRGSEAAHRRPAVIVSNDAANRAVESLGKGTVAVVPVTSNVDAVLPFHALIDAGAGGLSRDSKAQAEHVRAISPDRVGARLGRLPPAIMDRVDRALRLHLAL